jgi:hypothetical protein
VPIRRGQINTIKFYMVICNRCAEEFSFSKNDLVEARSFLRSLGWVYYLGEWDCPECVKHSGEEYPK